MKRLLHNVRLRVVDILGLDRMGKKYHMRTISYVFLMFYTTLEGVFVNTLLYRVSGGGMLSVIVYRGITYVSSGIFMHAAAYITQKKSPVMTARLGAMGIWPCTLSCLSGWRIWRASSMCWRAGRASGCFTDGAQCACLPLYDPEKPDAGIPPRRDPGIMTLSIPLVSGLSSS
jgi:hypothetical protein